MTVATLSPLKTWGTPSLPIVPRGSRLGSPLSTPAINSFKWNGPLDQAVAKLAQSIGYTFYTTAPPNAQPVAVAIEISSVPAYQVFQALGEEAGAHATVEVDALHHQVQVIHHV